MLARAVGLSIVILSGITAPDSIPEEFSAYAGKVCPPISVMDNAAAASIEKLLLNVFFVFFFIIICTSIFKI
mgnify:FL=1|jgi:hypothetical protein